MEMQFLDNLALGFSVAFRFEHIVYCLMGVLLGTLIGVLPGIGAAGFGSMDDFRSAYTTKAAQSFEDHFGTQYNIVFIGTMPEKSLTNCWDAASNEFRIPVTFYAIPV